MAAGLKDFLNPTRFSALKPAILRLHPTFREGHQQKIARNPLAPRGHAQLGPSGGSSKTPRAVITSVGIKANLPRCSKSMKQKHEKPRKTMKHHQKRLETRPLHRPPNRVDPRQGSIACGRKGHVLRLRHVRHDEVRGAAHEGQVATHRGGPGADGPDLAHGMRLAGQQRLQHQDHRHVASRMETKPSRRLRKGRSTESDLDSFKAEGP